MLLVYIRLWLYRQCLIVWFIVVVVFTGFTDNKKNVEYHQIYPLNDTYSQMHWVEAGETPWIGHPSIKKAYTGRQTNTSNTWGKSVILLTKMCLDFWMTSTWRGGDQRSSQTLDGKVLTTDNSIIYGTSNSHIYLPMHTFLLLSKRFRKTLLYMSKHTKILSGTLEPHFVIFLWYWLNVFQNVYLNVVFENMYLT